MYLRRLGLLAIVCLLSSFDLSKEEAGNSNILEKAKIAATRMQELVPELTLSAEEWFQIAFFIETKLTIQVAEKGSYLSRKATKLARTIEYDPETKLTFIHLETHGIPKIGEGHKKVVTKSILYDVEHPEVVARCVSKEPMPEEMEAAKKLKGLPGIAETYATTERTGSYALLCKYYAGGSLFDLVYQQKRPHALLKKMELALDILIGLESMHAQGMVHRDLSIRNQLIDVVIHGKQKKLKAVLTDFGRTVSIQNVAKVPVQGNSTYRAPEGFEYKKLKGDDYLATDIYAVGCGFYEIFKGRKGPWIDRDFVRDKTKPGHVVKRHLKRSIDRYRRERMTDWSSKNRVGKVEKSLEERFERLILKMIDPHPKKRGTATELRAELEAIVKDARDKARKKRQEAKKHSP